MLFSTKYEEFNLYTDPSINKEWICPKCCANELPFYDLSTNDLHLENIIPHNAKGGINLILDNNPEDLVKKCNSISTNLKDDQNDGDDLFNNINSKYYSMFEFNRIKNNLPSSMGICHTNIASLGKHIDELKLTLSLLKNEFHIIAITEHKFRRGIDNC